MAYEIPFKASSLVDSFSINLEGLPYRFDVRWNERDNEGAGAWYFDVYDAAGAPIAYGLKIVLGAYIGRRVNHPLFRGGVLVATDESGAGREATFDDLGTRVVVRYIPALEVSTVLSWLAAQR